MKKVLNTFKYGSAQVKGMLVLTLFSGAATVSMLLAAVILQQLLLFFGAIIALFITIFLSQTFSVREQDGETALKPKREPKEKPEKEPKLKREPREKLEKEPRQRKEPKEKPEKEPKQRKEKPEKEPRQRKESKEKPEKEPRQKKEPKDGAFSDADEAPQREIEQATREDLETYDKRKIRKTFRKYKVRRDHRMVLIDRSDRLSIYQTPAFVWVYEKQFHILLIEKEPRYITIPLHKLKKLTYLKKQPGNSDEDYGKFKSRSALAEMFRPYLPDYTHSTVVGDATVYKNLYGIGFDIYFTNRSVANLLDLLALEFCVDDKVTMSPKANAFFKDAYKSNILLRDNVIDANGYADRISRTLDELAHSAVSEAEFSDTLNLLVKNKLITQEFATYYKEVRDKISG